MDYKKIWKKANKELRASLPEHAYKAWIETLVPVGLTNDVFILEAPNRFAHEWINSYYYDFLFEAIKEHAPGVELKISIASPSTQSVLSERSTKRSPPNKATKEKGTT